MSKKIACDLLHVTTQSQSISDADCFFVTVDLLLYSGFFKKKKIAT